MATKYRVTASFDLTTEMEPEGIDRKIDSAVEDIDTAEDFEGGSYFGAQSVTCDGGEFSVTVEADDEDSAESLVREAIEDGMEYEDDNGFTWIVESVSFETEAITWEPTVEEAIQVLSDWVEDQTGGVGDPADPLQRVAIAAGVVLNDHERLSRRVASLETRLEEAHLRISGLVERVTQAEAQITLLSGRLAQ